MKNIKILMMFVLASAFFGCSDEDSDSINQLNNLGAPANISALVTITQDNSGMVTFRPTGEGATMFEVDYGDGTTELGTVRPGETISHTYAEGSYQPKITGVSLNGKRTTYTHDLSVMFIAPQNLAVSVTPVAGNSLGISVSATADYEAFFEVTYGDDPTAEPVQFNQGTAVSHSYTAPGTYTVTVTAYSGGAATTVHTETVTVTNPLLLPIDFENTTLNFAWGDFGGAGTSVVANPVSGGINASARVGKLTKSPGAETWSGTSLPIDQNIDFAAMHYIKMKVYSPAAGVTVKFKVENLANSSINYEVDAVTTVANQWETLTFNFAGINTAETYGRIVVFFNFGAWGGGESYYFDDINLVAGDAGVGMPLTFESATLNYVFNNFGGAVASRVDNPHATGINNSSKVGQFVKNNGAEVWAGTAMPMTSPLDFSVNKKIKVKVWSPAAGKVILLKLENLANSSINIERQATTTVANQWEELTFDFTGIVNSNNYQNVVLFCDFGNTGTGSTYYFDDFQQFN